MDVLSAVAYGAAGGAIVEAINLFEQLQDWQDARHAARTSGDNIPTLTMFVDVPANTAVALARFALGALAGLISHTQVDGVGVAVAVGASAPAVLYQLGSRAKRVPDPVLAPSPGIQQVAGEAGEATE